MILNVLKNKSLYTKEDGEQILDLTTKSVDFKIGVSVADVIMVNENQEMRPDLVSQAYYGTPDNLDMVLKFNGISNPFSLASGDILIIPELADMTNVMIDNNIFKTANDIRKQFLDPTKKSSIDSLKMKFNHRMREIAEDRIKRNIELNNPSKSQLPPNFNEFDEKEVTIENNRVIFGPLTSKNKEMCQPMTKTQLISKLIKNRLKRENNDNLGERNG